MLNRVFFITLVTSFLLTLSACASNQSSRNSAASMDDMSQHDEMFHSDGDKSVDEMPEHYDDMSKINPIDLSHISAQKRQVIEDLLNSNEEMEDSDEMLDTILNSFLLRSKQKLPPHIQAIFKEELKSVYKEAFIENNWQHDSSVYLYDKHFSEQELRELSAFYKTSTGKKVIKVMPLLNQQALDASQSNMRLYQPLLRQRILTRFIEEGIIKPTDQTPAF